MFTKKGKDMKIVLTKEDVEEAIRQYLRLYFYDHCDESKIKSKMEFFTERFDDKEDQPYPVDIDSMWVELELESE